MHQKPAAPLIRIQSTADTRALEDYIGGIVAHVDVLESRVDASQKKLLELEQVIAAKVPEPPPKKPRFDFFKRRRKGGSATVPEVHSPPPE